MLSDPVGMDFVALMQPNPKLFLDDLPLMTPAGLKPHQTSSAFLTIMPTTADTQGLVKNLLL